jgi:hypothetical protein
MAASKDHIHSYAYIWKLSIRIDTLKGNAPRQVTVCTFYYQSYSCVSNTDMQAETLSAKIFNVHIK